MSVAVAAAAWTLAVRQLIPMYLESTLRSSLARAGFDAPSFQVSRASTGRIVLTDVSLGAGAGLVADRIVVDYGLDSLWRRKLHRVTFHAPRVDPAAIDQRWVRKPSRGRRARLLTLPTDLVVVQGGELVLGDGVTVPISGSVRSGLGLHVTARATFGGAAARVDGAVFRLGSKLSAWARVTTPTPTAERNLDASVAIARDDDGTRVAGRAALRWPRASFVRDGHRATFERIAVDVSGALDDGRVQAGALEASAGELAIDDAELGTLRLSIAPDATALTATASLTGDHREVTIDASLPADLNRLDRAPVPLSWTASGALPEALAVDGAVDLVFESSGHGVATASPFRVDVAALELAATAARLDASAGSLEGGALRLSGAGHLSADDSELRVDGTVRARGLRARKVRARRVRGSVRARLARDSSGTEIAIELPRLEAARVSRGEVRSGAVVLAPPPRSRPARVVVERRDATTTVSVDGALALRRPVALRGAARGRLRSLEVALGGTLGPDAGKLRAPLDLRVDDLALADRDVSVSSLRVHAPLAFGRRGVTAGATVSLAGATITRGDIVLRGVDARLRLKRLASFRARGPQRVAWRSAKVGDRSLGGGSAAARALPGGVFAVDELELVFAGGTLGVAPFRLDVDRGELDLRLEARDLRLSRVAALVSRGKLAGRGRLRGELQLHADWRAAPTLEVTRAKLVSDDGRLLVRDRDLLLRFARAHDGKGALAERIASALSDFDYDELRLVVEPDGPGPRLVRIDLRGQGARTPQELDLTVNLRGLEELSSRAWRLFAQPALVTAERNL